MSVKPAGGTILCAAIAMITPTTNTRDTSFGVDIPFVETDANGKWNTIYAKVIAKPSKPPLSPKRRNRKDIKRFP
jgi:hypothetical protein